MVQRHNPSEHIHKINEKTDLGKTMAPDNSLINNNTPDLLFVIKVTPYTSLMRALCDISSSICTPLQSISGVIVL
jgi:hypothetical protein